MPNTQNTTSDATRLVAGASQKRELIEAALKLAGLNPEDYSHVEVTRKEGQITLPPGMPIPEAIKTLQSEHERQEKTVSVQERIVGFPLDVANALFLAIKEKFGFHTAKSTQGFFGPQPPSFITIPTDAVGGQVTILTGQFSLPGIEGKFGTAPDDSTALILGATVKQKYVEEVKSLARLTREVLKSHSLYQGKAIKIDSSVQVGGMVQPTFIDVRVGHEPIFLNADVLALVEAAIWNPIMYSDACLEIGAPLNGGALLEGNYGTGKTLCAAHTARICLNEGWTYVYCPRPEDLIYVYNTARQWQTPTKGVVVFVEDIDRLAGDEEAVKHLSVVLDGVDNKDNKLILVATSNHADKVPVILRRSKRIGHTIHFSEPDARVIKQLVEFNAKNPRTGESLLASDIDWQVVTQALAGCVAATIKDVVDTAKKRAVKRSPLVITTEDLVGIAKQIFRAEPPQNEPTRAEKLAEALMGVVREAVGMGDQDHDLDDVYSMVDTVDDKAIELKRMVKEIQPADYSDELNRIEERVRGIDSTVDRIYEKLD